MIDRWLRLWLRIYIDRGEPFPPWLQSRVDRSSELQRYAVAYRSMLTLLQRDAQAWLPLSNSIVRSVGRNQLYTGPASVERDHRDQLYAEHAAVERNQLHADPTSVARDQLYAVPTSAGPDQLYSEPTSVGRDQLYSEPTSVGRDRFHHLAMHDDKCDVLRSNAVDSWVNSDLRRRGLAHQRSARIVWLTSIFAVAAIGIVCILWPWTTPLEKQQLTQQLTQQPTQQLTQQLTQQQPPNQQAPQQQRPPNQQAPNQQASQQQLAQRSTHESGSGAPQALAISLRYALGSVQSLVRENQAASQHWIEQSNKDFESATAEWTARINSYLTDRAEQTGTAFGKSLLAFTQSSRL